jgi:hypothetical protein
MTPVRPKSLALATGQVKDINSIPTANKQPTNIAIRIGVAVRAERNCGASESEAYAMTMGDRNSS